MASVFGEAVLTPTQAARRRARLDVLLEPDVLKALAEPTRTRLLSCLLKCGRPCSVTEVAACCSVDFSMVSRHLAALARAGLLTAEKRGRTVWYAADAVTLAARFRSIADAIDELAPSLTAEGACPPGCCAAPDATERAGAAANGRALPDTTSDPTRRDHTRRKRNTR